MALAFARDVLDGRFRAVLARMFRVVGLGSRSAVSQWVRAAIRKEPIDIHRPESRFGVFSHCIAVRLRERLGWSPATSLKKGVRHLVNYEVGTYVRA